MKSWPTNSNTELCLPPQRKNFEEHATHLTTESFDLLICTLKLLQGVGWTPEKRAQDHRQSYTSDQLHLTYSCTAPISTARLNSGHQRASTAWDGFAHSASLQTRCCFRPDWGTTISRNRYSHTQDSKHGSTLHCHNLGHYCSRSSECSLLPHHHLNKAGKDELCRDPRKLAKERRLTGSSYILTFSCFPLFYLKSRKSILIFKYEPLVVFQRHNVNHGTCFLMISYHRKSLIYWKTIHTEVKARTAVLEYWYTEN